jgi:hypothetical protein
MGEIPCSRQGRKDAQTGQSNIVDEATEGPTRQRRSTISIAAVEVAAKFVGRSDDCCGPENETRKVDEAGESMRPLPSLHEEAETIPGR